MLDVNISGRRGSFDYDFCFQSDAGVTALFGASGAGKTTIIDALSGVLRPDKGRILVDDGLFFESVQAYCLSSGHRRVGHIFQEGRLFPHMSVKINLTYARWAGGRSSDAVSFDDVVALLGLEGLLARAPSSLSGGERQRVAIGRALLSDPQLLLMDEPLSGLDFQRKREIIPYLERLAHESDLPVVYVSHELDEVVRLANHLVLVDSGHVVCHGPTAEILPKVRGHNGYENHAPNSLLKASFQRFDETYDLTWLSVGVQELAVSQKLQRQDHHFNMRINASDVALALEAPKASSIQNTLKGTVMRLDHENQSFCDVTVNVEGQALIARISLKACDDLRLEVGVPIYALIKSVAVQGILSSD